LEKNTIIIIYKPSNYISFVLGIQTYRKIIRYVKIKTKEKVWKWETPIREKDIFYSKFKEGK